RVGESLRAVYRYRVNGVVHHVAARTGPRAAAPAVPAPEVGANLWPFPHDRKLAALPKLAALSDVLGEPVTTRLAAHAPEQSATAECRAARGQVIAYAKVQREAAPVTLPNQAVVRVPRILATGDVLLLEALAGRRLDHLTGDELVRALH